MQQVKSIVGVFTISLMLFASCGSSENMEVKKTMDTKLDNGHFIIDAEIVEKSYEFKNSKTTTQKELYVRRSVQDYYIKFCESEVTQTELAKEIILVDGIANSLKLEVEIKDGSWDQCNSEELVQSRTGSYMVIYKIIK